MVHDERDRAAPPFDPTVMLDPIPAALFPWSTVTLFHRARKKEGLKIFTESQWKSFGKVLTIFVGLQMILQSEESRSAVTKILQYEEKAHKRVLVLNVWIS